MKHLALGSFILLGASSAAWAAGEVTLLHGYSTTGYIYHATCGQRVGATVKTKALGAGGSVVVHAKLNDGTWADWPMAYAGPAEAGFDAWRFEKSIGGSMGVPCYDQEWAIKYSVNGIDYWDSNNGANYKIGMNGGWLLNGPKIVLADSAIFAESSQKANGGIAIRDNAPNKTVKVRYTLDGTNWSDVDAQYNAAYPVRGGSGNVTSPNAFGTEMWSFAVPMQPAQKLTYAVNMTINGQQTWDNNFGRNYIAYSPRHFRMYVRGTTENAWEGVYMIYNYGTGNWERQVTFNAASNNRFKFDANSDWVTNYGDNAPADGKAEQGGTDILLPNAGTYNITFNDTTYAYSVTCVEGACKNSGGDWKRTVIFIQKQTISGQDLFIRGGIDHGYAATKGINCTAANKLCAIPIKHKWRVDGVNGGAVDANFVNDKYLDWYGIEPGQATNVMGSPLAWTTNIWPGEWGAKKTVPANGYGEYALNTWGQHYWLMEVDMDCSKTQNGWFELKGFLTNYNVNGGWENDINQPGRPYTASNHFGQCGKLNKFVWGGNDAQITALQ